MKNINRRALPLLSRECEQQQQEEQMEREARVLQGLVECLLPRVGGHVATLDLAHGTAVSNEMVRELREELST